MQNNAFSKIARYYDIFSGASHKEYCGFICRTIDKYSIIKVTDVLDLGCGTAALTDMLCKKGYGMIGVDESPDMLSEARSKYSDILFLQQDMRRFELYGTVQAAVCTYDGLNYLLSKKDLEDVFRLLKNYIEPHGLFIFDINTLYKYKNVLSDNAFVYENGGDMLIWQNYYNDKTKRCDFYLTLFEASNDGTYIRSDEYQRQKYFSEKTLLDAAEKNGFKLVSAYGGLNGEPCRDTDEKTFYVMERGA